MLSNPILAVARFLVDQFRASNYYLLVVDLTSLSVVLAVTAGLKLLNNFYFHIKNTKKVILYNVRRPSPKKKLTLSSMSIVSAEPPSLPEALLSLSLHIYVYIFSSS
jgi:hypothetical protein